MTGLFINYRREDTAPYAGRICDHLRRAFPEHKVFMDIDAIDPGEDFVNAINNTLSASKVVLAVIGPEWETIADAGGQRRLDNPDDYVVRELRAALDADVRVIPVLVGDASMPRTNALPASLQGLARRQAIEISDGRFVSDIGRLCGAISRVVGSPAAPAVAPAAAPTAVRAPAPAVAPAPAPARERAPEPVCAAAAAPDSLPMFKTLLWADYALEIFIAMFEFGRASEDAVGGMVIVGLIAVGVAAWLNVMLIRGRNWARMGYLGVVIVFFPFIEWSQATEVEIVGNLVSFGVSIWLIRMMFTDPLKKYFDKPSRTA